MAKQVLCIFLAALLILGLTGIVSAETISTEDSGLIPIGSEKIYCRATLEDNFTDDKLIVVLTNSESLKFSSY